MSNLSSVESIFHAALQKGSAEGRAAYLDEACAGDEETEVYALGGQIGMIPRAAVFSPDGKRMASASGLQVKTWDAATGQKLLSLTAPAQKPYSAVQDLAFTPDGNRLLAALNDGTVKYWDATPLPAAVK